MKKSLIFAMAMALGVAASAYAANPFSDVPAGHWAYDSIEKLAAAGVIDGYGDGTFGGDKLMTRYEMAQIVAKAMAKGANVDKLAAEFADELDALGVRVANLEKKADAVKIAGEIRLHYADIKNNSFNPKIAGLSSAGSLDASTSALRSRIWFQGQINDDWTYTGMLENIQDFAHSDTGDERVDFQRAYIEGRIGGVEITAGRQNLVLVNGNLYDERADMIQASYGKDVKLTVFGGKPTGQDDSLFATDVTSLAMNYREFYGANVVGKWGTFGANAGFTIFKDGNVVFDNGAAIERTDLEDNKVWNVGLSYDINDDLTLTADYMKTSLDKVVRDRGVYTLDDDGIIVGLDYKGARANKPGSWGVYGKYYDQGRGTEVAHTMNGNYKWNGHYFNGPDNRMGTFNSGFKGWMLGANYAFAKNIVGAVEYYDLKTKDLGSRTIVDEQKVKTLWSELVFTF